ncbi:C-type lectin domain family 4 member [Acrasis kona]|uniref:C-type lectin domain family 4 member n=1 Tax=Acrasis kona TaxID=1008807 RepID=A0AAW2YZR7_9EUKA
MICKIALFAFIVMITMVQPKAQDACHLYNGNCYFKSIQLKSHSGAESYCQSQGGHLASITSQDENNFITTLLSGVFTYWIGTTYGSNTWTDGSPYSYTNWDDDRKTVGRCAYIQKKELSNLLSNNGQWDTSTCTLPKFFVCKVPTATSIIEGATTTETPTTTTTAPLPTTTETVTTTLAPTEVSTTSAPTSPPTTQATTTEAPTTTTTAAIVSIAATTTAAPSTTSQVTSTTIPSKVIVTTTASQTTSIPEVNIIRSEESSAGKNVASVVLIVFVLVLFL